MTTKVRKWGNSLGVRIPKAIAEQVGVEAGTIIEFAVRDGEIVLRPGREDRLRLEDLLAGVTARNRHEKVDTGDAVGREGW